MKYHTVTNNHPGMIRMSPIVIKTSHLSSVLSVFVSFQIRNADLLKESDSDRTTCSDFSTSLIFSQLVIGVILFSHNQAGCFRNVM